MYACFDLDSCPCTAVSAQELFSHACELRELHQDRHMFLI